MGFPLINNDSLHYVHGVENALTGADITNATVTACVLASESANPDSAALSNSSITLAWDAAYTVPETGATGAYVGTFPDTIAMTAGTRYWRYTKVVSGTLQVEFRDPFKARYGEA